MRHKLQLYLVVFHFGFTCFSQTVNSNSELGTNNNSESEYVFTEFFDNNYKNWGIIPRISDDRTSIEIKDGRYIVNACNGVSTSLIAAKFDKRQSFLISIEATIDENDINPKSTFGVAFGATDNDNYYTFSINAYTTYGFPNKTFVIGKVTNGKFKTLFTGDLNIKKFKKCSNYKFEIRFHNDKWYFIINDNELHTISANTQISLTDFGPGLGIFQIGYNFNVAYDNLQILSWGE